VTGHVERRFLRDQHIRAQKKIGHVAANARTKFSSSSSLDLSSPTTSRRSVRQRALQVPPPAPILTYRMNTTTTQAAAGGGAGRGPSPTRSLVSSSHARLSRETQEEQHTLHHHSSFETNAAVSAVAHRIDDHGFTHHHHSERERRMLLEVQALLDDIRMERQALRHERGIMMDNFIL
jgi:hypothetical protein